jgi:alpha-N-acetylglucosaminidase
MKKGKFLLQAIICLVLFVIPITLSAENVAARGLFNRLLGDKSRYFLIEEGKSLKGADFFEIENAGKGKILIRGNDANSIAVGLNHYLRYYCKTSVSWYEYDRVQLPETLPAVPAKITVNSVCKDRFFLNYCTFGYTMPWWQWRDWERFIDWMALNGVNMPLAITGQESVWYRVWRKAGLTDQEIRNYFTGPAHLPWHRMLNMDYWQGPLPHSWLENQEALQKKIVARERELNMTPVLPAFSGHVPYELKRIYPDAKISKLSQWGGFDTIYRSSFLDPMDPLFKKIQKDFLEEQTKLFGSDHIYGIDPFNEIVPPSWEPEYLARVSRTIFETLSSINPKAIWLQMSWLYYYQRKDWTNPRIEAFVRAVPQDKMILLDYFCEKTEVWKMTDKFFGQPYIWCYLGNFGGNTMLAGDLDDVGTRIDNTFKNGGANFRGLGSTLEGFDCNPMMFEYVFDKAWSYSPGNDEWIKAWADRRSGNDDANVREAWDILHRVVYKTTSKTGHCNMVTARPNMQKQERYAKTGIPYDNRELFRAWGLMLKASDTGGDLYRYDLVNIGRQALGNYFDLLWERYKKAFAAKDAAGSAGIEKEMITLLDDIDRLLGTNTTFLLGKWIADARQMGIDPAEADYYESNARDILTSWGDKGQLLSDYANRAWAGLISSFYKERWKMFFDFANTALALGGEFDQKGFDQKVTDFEGDWWSKRIGNFPSKPTGDPVAISRELFAKYSCGTI